MSIFEFSNYQSFLKDHIQNLPKKGWGFPQRLAEHLGIHPSHISQVLSSSRDFSIEQAVATAEFLGLTSLELDYFLTLVNLGRAGNVQTKNYYKKKAEELKKSSLNLSRRVNQDKILSEEEKSVFYSSYIYSAIRLFCSVGEGVTLDEIRKRFDLSREKAVEVIEFLLRTGLVAQKDGLFVMGTQHTHVEKGSPHLSRHHLNWRVQALERIESLTENELQFTGPVSLSKKDFDKIREMLVKTINDSLKVVKESPAEEIACLNLDFFWIKPEAK